MASHVKIELVIQTSSNRLEHLDYLPYILAIQRGIRVTNKTKSGICLTMWTGFCRIWQK